MHARQLRDIDARFFLVVFVQGTQFEVSQRILQINRLLRIQKLKGTFLFPMSRYIIHMSYDNDLKKKLTSGISNYSLQLETTCGIYLGFFLKLVYVLISRRGKKKGTIEFL